MALGLYIHIPYCRSKCAYCAFVSSPDCSTMPLYMTRLSVEIRQRAVSDAVDTVYIGGGTPSMLKRGMLGDLIADVRASYNVISGAEITVEANPDSCTGEFAAEVAACGVNRVSLGLQSADDDIIRAMRRPHTYADFLRATDNLTREGITNIGCDVMLGLPGDTVGGVLTTLQKAVAAPIKHVSVYALKIEEGTPLYDAGLTEDEDLQADMYESCYSFLKSKGFERYEVSNFCLKGHESRHNLKYWTYGQYLGFGAAAHSFYGGERLANTENVSAYNAGRRPLREVISREEAVEEYVMLALRTRDGLDADALLERLSYDIMSEKAEQIERLAAQKLIIVQKNRIKLAEDAFFVMNGIISALI